MRLTMAHCRLPIAHCVLAMLAFVVATAARADDATDFRAICTAKSAEAEKARKMAVAARDGWLFLDSELRHLGIAKFWGKDSALVSHAQDANQADPLPAILDFKRQLDRLGIELIVVPVPAKASIYPDKLDARFKPGARLDDADREFAELLRENGVTVIDLTDALIKARARSSDLYCRQDSHWSGHGCVIAASAIAQHVRQRPWAKQIAQLKLASAWREVEIAGDLWREQPEPRPAREELSLRFVGQPREAELKPLDDNSDSPVVLLGDSHCLIFHDGDDMLAAGAGLPDQLALELGFALDLVAVRGSGATPARVNFARRARRDGYLARKKLVIWCFSVRDYTESAGWSKIAIEPR